MLCELHCHSNFSDGISNVQDIIKKAQRIIGAIAITDHNTMKGYENAKIIKSNILIIPGLEVSSKDGHIIALGVEEVVEKGQTAEDTVDDIHMLGGIAIAAHPFGELKRHGVKDLKLLKHFDAIEAINGMTFPQYNKMSIELAKKAKKPMVSGSDAHVLDYIGRYSCNIDGNTVDEILHNIKAGKVGLPKNTVIREVVGYKLKRVFSR